MGAKSYQVECDYWVVDDKFRILRRFSHGYLEENRGKDTKAETGKVKAGT